MLLPKATVVEIYIYRGGGAAFPCGTQFVAPYIITLSYRHFFYKVDFIHGSGIAQMSLTEPMVIYVRMPQSATDRHSPQVTFLGQDGTRTSRTAWINSTY